MMTREKSGAKGFLQSPRAFIFYPPPPPPSAKLRRQPLAQEGRVGFRKYVGNVNDVTYKPQ